MILDSLNCTKEAFEAGTGWALKAEGACKGDVCIPLGDIKTDPVDIKAIAHAMNLPLAEEAAAKLWALGPDSIGGRTLSTAKAPELELPDVNGENFKLSSLKGKKVLVYAWAPYWGCSGDLPVWQTLREELKQIDDNFELVTVGMDTLGLDGCKHFIDAAKPEHPSLIDQHHVLADLFGVVNIPSSIWIDETGNIVRPAEAAPAPPQDGQTGPNIDMPAEMPQRMIDMLTEAVKIPNQKDEYHAALRDWLKQGKKSQFSMSEQQVVERSRPRNSDNALGHAHFELATQLEMNGEHQLAIKHFRLAHELVPDSWTFKRQAWSLETVGEGPLARFWQGPNPESPDDWPYEGDWLADIKSEGAENYNEGWQE